MQRPPRPIIKTSQLFPYSKFRKAITTQLLLNQLQICLQQQVIRSMRDIKSQLHSQLQIPMLPNTAPIVSNTHRVIKRVDKCNLENNQNIGFKHDRQSYRDNYHESLNKEDLLQTINNIKTKGKFNTIPNIQSSQNEITSQNSSQILKNTKGSKTKANHLNKNESLNRLGKCDLYCSGNIISGRSFKVRNMKSYKGVKENTVAINKNSQLSLNVFNRQQQNSQNYIVLKLESYPQHSHIYMPQLGSKLNFKKLYYLSGPQISSQPQTMTLSLNNTYSCSSKVYSQWCLIISQSLFYGSLIQQVNLLKLRNLLNNIHKSYLGICVIIRLHSERQINQVEKIIIQRGLQVEGILWGKSKYIETTNFYDITEISVKNNLTKYIIVEDTHQIMQSVYYQTKVNQSENNHNNDSINIKQDIKNNDNVITADHNSKYLYLKFKGFGNLIKFIHKIRLCLENQKVIVNVPINCLISKSKDRSDLKYNQKYIQNSEHRQRQSQNQLEGWIDDTSKVMSLQQMNERIKIVKVKKYLRKNSIIVQKQQSRKIKSRNKSVDRNQKNSKEANIKQTHKNQYSQELKTNLLKHFKFIQSQQTKTKNQPIQIKITNKQPNKSYEQLINQLLKKNTVIMKQIAKYQQKVFQSGILQIFGQNQKNLIIQ